jgi:hypothetical protein
MRESSLGSLRQTSKPLLPAFRRNVSPCYEIVCVMSAHAGDGDGSPSARIRPWEPEPRRVCRDFQPAIRGRHRRACPSSPFTGVEAAQRAFARSRRWLQSGKPPSLPASRRQALTDAAGIRVRETRQVWWQVSRSWEIVKESNNVPDTPHGLGNSLISTILIPSYKVMSVSEIAFVDLDGRGLSRKQLG